MKTLLIYCCTFLFFGTLLSCSSTTANDTVFDEEMELNEIMQVIDRETHCFFSGDYNCWQSTWAHKDYSMQAWNNNENSYDAVVGWDNIDKQGHYWIKEYYGDGSNILFPYVKRDKPIVKFFGDHTAYLVWTQYNADKDRVNFYKSQESRLLEKETDGWKIVNVTAFWDRNSKHPINEVNATEDDQ